MSNSDHSEHLEPSQPDQAPAEAPMAAEDPGAMNGEQPQNARMGKVAKPAPTGVPAPAKPGVSKDRKPIAGMVLAAVGIVFGDIGTSPLYSLQTVFSIDHNRVAPTPGDVYGIISLVFWAITTIVSVKYVALVMRADNKGEGGILALTALLRRIFQGRRPAHAIIVLGIVGAGLFFGDSLITPAISVMSAVEGLQVVNPGADELVLPLSLVILSVLFMIQRFGTAVVGKTFGPIMVIWFVTLAAMGIPEVVAHPAILKAFSPTYALTFAIDRPIVAFIAMGAIVLCITGAEALYADMGHFRARPIRLAWFCVVLPALIINYMGQGALILRDPSAIDNPFFHLAPKPLVVPLVIMATLATVIASQAVISGAFSVANQARHLDLMPRVTVRHTSKKEGGQIYVPTINWMLFVGVLLLIAGFQSSAALANAYGLAVTGTLLLTTILFFGLADKGWHWPMWVIVVAMVIIGGLEATFFAANLTKIVHGGWLPIVIALFVIAIMTTWLWGDDMLAARRREIEGPLDDWIAKVNERDVPRVPGQALVLHSNFETVPLALKENLRFNHVIHEEIAIISVRVLDIPHVPHSKRIEFSDLGNPDDGIWGITITLGFNDSQNVPHNLRWSQGKCDRFEWDPKEARYFLSVLTVHASEGRGLTLFRKKLFAILTRNAGSRVESFHLPPNRTAVLGGNINL